MDIFTVSFFGHRRINDSISIGNKLEIIICDLLRQKEYVEFLVGRDRDFDMLVASTILRCKRTIRDDNSVLVWVMPYETAEYRENECAFNDYYDEIEVCEESETAYYKAAFQKRNYSMVDRSDLVVFYVERKSGGAFKTLNYAQKQGKAFYNFSEL